ncbi:MAG: D-alanine--D-alanine ligase [Albidovulum sp.]|nr:D-alanine--D-alanine ligase [Albidovulum sp.]
MSSRPSGIRVAVLKGGPSSERDVSLVSGKECAAALRNEGFGVVEIDAGTDLSSRLETLEPDIVFNALHGRWGEDGCVQGILEWMKIPYTHSGVLASSLAMDKQRAKAVFAAEGLPCAEGRLISVGDLADAHPMNPPYVIKPNNEGSSVGVSIVRDRSEIPKCLDEITSEVVMVERFVPGRELTVSVMLDEPLTVTDIRTHRSWYDYKAKYDPGGSRHIVPANIPSAVFEASLDYALRAHRVLGCRGLSRSDFRWDDRLGVDGLFILETNTQPGMTPTSLSPEQAAACGVEFDTLCRKLVEDATCGR